MPDIEGGNLALALGVAEAGLVPLPKEDIVQFFKLTERTAVIDRLSRINTAMGLGGLDEFAFQKWLAPAFLRPEWIESINKHLAGRPDVRLHSILDPRRLRLAIRLALLHSPVGSGQTIEDPEARFKMGHVLLSLDSSFADEEVEPCSESDPLHMLYLALIFERQAHFHERNTGAKHSLFSFLISELLGDNDLRQDFIGATGVTPGECYRVLLVLQSYFGQLDPAHVVRFNATNADPRRIFGQCRIPKRVGEAVLSRFCFDVRLDEMPVAVDDRYWNNLVFVRRPFALLDDNSLTCIDSVYSNQVLFRGLFTLLEEVLGDAKIMRLYQPKGDAFESFCSNVMREASESRVESGAKWYPPGTVLGNESDGIYEEGPYLILCECKSGHVRSALRFGTSPAALADDLNKKYVSGTAQDPKGLAQLALKARNLAKFWTPPAGYGGISIFPLLVVEDDFVASKAVAQYLVASGQQHFQDAPPSIRRPQVVSSGDLIDILHRTSRHSPVDVLLEADRNGLTGYLSFGNMVADCFAGAPRVPWDERHSFLKKNPFADDAAAILRASLRPTGAPACPTCGLDLVMINRLEGMPTWQCPGKDCAEASRPVTQLELQEWASARQADIDWYESS